MFLSIILWSKNSFTMFLCQAMVACAAGLLQFNVGYGMGLSSPMIAQLTGSYLDQVTSSWFASSLTIGQALGSVLGGGLANKLGRKRVCMVAAAASILSWVLLSSSQAFWMLILGRILTGRAANCKRSIGNVFTIMEKAY